MKTLQVVIPMAGSGRRFRDAGYTEPKPLIDVAGEPMISRLVRKFPLEWRFVFICSEDDLKSSRLREVLTSLAPGCEIKGIASHKLGPVHTVLMAGDAVQPDLPTIINYCDFGFAWDPEHFLEFIGRTECDGAVFCYRGFQPHYISGTLYAYCKEEGGRILEVKEKGHFTPDRTREYASSGSYFFSSGALALKYLRTAKERELAFGGEYYMSLVYNPMIQDRLKVLVYEIPYFCQWGTPEDLEDYLYWHRLFERFSARDRKPGPGPRLLMTMAGQGSRFEGAGTPKPLIPIKGKPMFLAAAGLLPSGGAPPLLALRRPIEPAVRQAAPDAELFVLDEQTSGQAETAAKAASRLDPDEPVLVSSCDHGLLWDEAAWQKLLAEGPDLVVVGVRGYPDVRRSPESYSYIDAGSGGRIRRVSVKKALGPSPREDLLLVGTFYFRTSRLLSELAGELLSRGVKVGGEVYLDSVGDLAVERGLDVRAFEAWSYLNWGSPDALDQFLYWDGYFTGTKP
ncbi:MAG: NTP transferase domain-containing protein [Elusimicrobia bacterium]|nr:NTP transferase domain-containing protein [Elusimicrobiota bacterium]